MAKKAKQPLNPTLEDLGAAFSEIFEEIKAEAYEGVDRGLDKAATFLKGKLEAATPVESGLTRGDWEVEFRYTNVRYISNNRLNEKGIPVVNLLEFGSKGKPFVRKTVAENQDEIIDIIKGEIQNGNT